MNMLQTLAVKWRERETAQGFKGKTADKLAFEFMAGAATALQVAGHPEAEHVTNYVAMVISVRGAFELRRIASEVQTKAA